MFGFRQKLYDLRAAYRKDSRRLTNLDTSSLQVLGLQDSAAYETTGVSPGDTAFLHHYIKTRRPSRVIEFGTGKSTWVIARAMSKYSTPPLALVSMEEEPEWYEAQLAHMPKLGDFVEIRCSETESWSHGFITGRVYSDTPLEQYDFCFVDGPSQKGSCSLDFIRLLERTDEPTTALIDGRQTTQMACACLLGADKVQRFRNKLALIENVTRRNLKKIIAYNDIFRKRQNDCHCNIQQINKTRAVARNKRAAGLRCFISSARRGLASWITRLSGLPFMVRSRLPWVSSACYFRTQFAPRQIC